MSNGNLKNNFSVYGCLVPKWMQTGVSFLRSVSFQVVKMAMLMHEEEQIV